jgi:hypothetical protein
LFGLAGLSPLLSHVNCKQVLYNNYWLDSPSISRAWFVPIETLFAWMVLAFLITFLAFLLAGVVVAVGFDEGIANALLLHCCCIAVALLLALLFCCCFIAVALLLLCCCCIAVELLLRCCCVTVALLLCCCCIAVGIAVGVTVGICYWQCCWHCCWNWSYCLLLIACYFCIAVALMLLCCLLLLRCCCLDSNFHPGIVGHHLWPAIGLVPCPPWQSCRPW